MKNKFLILTLSLALASSSLLILPASAAEQKPSGKMIGFGKRAPHFAQSKDRVGHGVFGTIASVSGSVFTVTVNPPPFHSSSTEFTTKVFTVNTDSETVFKKDGQNSTISDLVVGAKVMVRGEITTSTLSVAAYNVDLLTKLPDKPKKDFNQSDLKKIKTLKNSKDR